MGNGFKHESIIYFLQSSCKGLVKIGYTTNYFSRLRLIKDDLRFCSYTFPGFDPDGLCLLGFLSGGLQEEIALHQRFNKYRWYPSKRCEWFYPIDDLRDFIMMELPPIQSHKTQIAWALLFQQHLPPAAHSHEEQSA